MSISSSTMWVLFDLRIMIEIMADLLACIATLMVTYVYIFIDDLLITCIDMQDKPILMPKAWSIIKCEIRTPRASINHIFISNFVI